MVTSTIEEALTRQINREIYSAYLYMAMASYAESEGFKGFANWFEIQTREELEHAEKMYSYLQKQGSRVIMQAIEEPPQNFSSLGELFDKTLEHEKNVTKLINDLAGLAKSKNDSATENFLEWFVKEQIEEEATPANILGKIDETGEDKEGLLKVDSELAKRQ